MDINDFCDELVAVDAVNSNAFIQSMFDGFSKGQTLCVVKAQAELPSELEFSSHLHPANGSGWGDYELQQNDSEQIAQICFSSGTEGKPKAILISYRALSDTVNRLNKIMEVDQSIREYVGVPVYYSFGFGRCRAVSAVGGKFFIPENGFSPIEIKNMLENDQINAISAVPTLWRLVLENAETIGTLGKKIKWIEIGSQSMSKEEKRKMIQLFPNAKIVQHYGLTEASRTTLFRIDGASELQLDSVGPAVNLGCEVEVDNKNIIKIRGKHLCSGLLENGKIKKITDSEGWLTTSDQGQIKDGYLYFEGRADDLINCGGVKVNPDYFQNALSQKFGSSNKIAISKYPDATRGDGILLVVENSENLNLKQIEKQFAIMLDQYASGLSASLRYFSVDRLPRTETGKIKRKDLTQLYLQSNSPARAVNKTKVNATFSSALSEFYERNFPNQKIDNNITFDHAGGDSLNYVEASMLIEKYLGYLPDNWENMSIRELKALPAKKTGYWPEIDITILLRALAIIAVVLTHSGFNWPAGGTLLLFILIGFNIGRFKITEFVAGNVGNWFVQYTGKLLIPYFILMALFVVMRHEFLWSTLFLSTNLLELKVTYLFPFWFVQVLFQCLLVILLLFKIEWFRNNIEAHKFNFCYAVLAIFIVNFMILNHYWDTASLRHLVPQNFIMLLWLGITMSMARTPLHIGLILAASFFIGYQHVGLDHKLHWFIDGPLLVMLMPKMRIYAPLKTLFSLIALSTFYIFIFNGLFINVGLRLPLIEEGVSVAVFALFASTISWKIADWLQLDNKLAKQLSRFQKQPQ